MEVVPPTLDFPSAPTQAASSAPRYETLLQQIVQLNTDLQKTVALSQSLQRERDGLTTHNHKLKDEATRLHERCEKLQLVLMQETEQRIEADKKHEELIAKWKKQLELKAKAFENLQQKFAPPRDLDQLRMQIQAELDEPHHQRVLQLQQEIEKQRGIAFSIRRDYEVLKTEYEQFAVDQGNELESLHASYEMRLSDLKRKVVAAEERAQDAHTADSIRRIEQQKNAALIEVKLMHDEVKDVRDDFKRFQDQAFQERSELESRLADEMARNATAELDQKAAVRQLSRLKDDYEAMRAKWDHAQTKLLELTTENDKLRDQMKQREQLVFNSHQSVTTKLREERDVWERERASMTERLNELSQKLQASESALANQRNVSRRDNANTSDMELSSTVSRAKDEEIEKLRHLAATLERKAAEKEDELRVALSESDDALQRAKGEESDLRQKIHAMELEREQLNVKQSSTQELMSKIKSECMMLRTKMKETEIDYRTLQAKHRETIQLHEDIQLEKEQLEAKLKFAEADCLALREQLEKEKEDHAATVHEWQSKYSVLETSLRSQNARLREDSKQALGKAMRELSRAQKKRDTFKQKCLDLHEQYKLLVAELQTQDSRVLQLKHDHASELQHVLTQLAQVENDKTALLQRHMSQGRNQQE